MIEVTVENDIPKLVQNIDAQIHNALIDTTRALQQELGTRAPGHTIRRSLRRRQVGRHRHTITAVWWSTFVNYGTRHQAARPFIEPTIVSQQPKLLARLKDILGG